MRVTFPWPKKLSPTPLTEPLTLRYIDKAVKEDSKLRTARAAR